MTSAHVALAARSQSLASALARVGRRIDAACSAAGRPRGDVQLIVVTKFFPVQDIEALCALGVTDIGESRDQEASAKIAALPAEVRRRLQVHFIGQLQSNKASSLASYADTVHSIDRQKVVLALDRAASAADRTVSVLIQVRLGGGMQANGRGGIPPEGVSELARVVAGARHLTLRGVMAVAPLGKAPAEAFAELDTVARRLRVEHPEARWVSAGMSADLEAAVASGATHLRVGSAILGSRPVLG